MRFRLLGVLLTLLVLVLGVLTVPLATAAASRDTQTMFLDRVNDTVRFASLAETALRTGQTSGLRAELSRYEELFGIGVLIVGRDGEAVMASGPGVDLGSRSVRLKIDEGLSGNRSATAGVVWPWRDDPLIVVEPVGRGGEIIGAALTVSPTERLRGATVRSWTALLGQGLLVLMIGVVAATYLTRWLLRPVHRLDTTAQALTEGRFGERVGTVSGPPELRRLANSFNAMAEQISVLVERQRAFVSYASHQLRTPLARLRLSMDNLASQTTPEGQEDHQMVVEEIERMASLYDALLAYAHAEATSAEVDDIDVGSVADERAAAWQAVAANAGIGVVRTGAARSVCRAAADTLDQVLDALIDNAVKFSGEGSTVTLMVKEPAGGWVDVHVVDTGPGMGPDELRRAAEPFWRHPRDQNLDGSGLGVTIAHALVTACGGALDLLPAEPHGVDARIRLPAPPSPQDKEAPS
ncbi:sensor histidine kinase [Spirillospora sp. NPDC048911]|uniref:sensor histidine kinase n=1 Tax=Spirillospora sp. NPDC048911 TaxID=3364527 RepID=UPI00371A3DE9